MHQPTQAKSKALKPGDTIGIISPSWFGGTDFIARARRGIATLESMGFKTMVGAHAFNTRGFVSDTAENRVADFHAMFEDDAVKAIICTIGGDHSNHLLPLIDWDLVRVNPKIFMGFSDITVLNLAIWSQTSLVTFNGPTLLTDWAEFPSMPDFSRDGALGMLTNPEPFGAIRSCEEWTEEFLDWRTGADLTRRRIHQPGEGWIWLRQGNASGPLVGGCLESMDHLRGTPYWPDFNGSILFLETSDERPSPETVDAILMDYENMSVFEHISGLLVARPYGYTDDMKERLWQVVTERTRKFDFPVIGNLDIGHTSPIQTLPIGVNARIDSSARTIEIIDAAVMD